MTISVFLGAQGAILTANLGPNPPWRRIPSFALPAAAADLDNFMAYA
jgi:hypothetical protein